MTQHETLKPLWTFNAVLDVLGGPGEVGKLTDQTSAAVCNWRRLRGLFPSKYYFTMKAALADRGFYAPISLFGFHGTERSWQRARRSLAKHAA
jgi:hypothetical protein